MDLRGRKSVSHDARQVPPPVQLPAAGHFHSDVVLGPASPRAYPDYLHLGLTLAVLQSED